MPRVGRVSYHQDNGRLIGRTLVAGIVWASIYGIIDFNTLARDDLELGWSNDWSKPGVVDRSGT